MWRQFDNIGGTTDVEAVRQYWRNNRCGCSSTILDGQLMWRQFDNKCNNGQILELFKKSRPGPLRSLDIVHPVHSLAKPLQ